MSFRRAALATALLALVIGPRALARAPEGFSLREAMVPRRDGVRLHTAVFTPKGVAEPLAILLERAPYDAMWLCPLVLGRYRSLAASGYVFVCQDLRSKYRSEGTFATSSPPRRHGSATDETTDAWDTIGWFPLIDRNPQRYVPNIYLARDTDYVPAEHRVFRERGHPSHLEVSVATNP